MTSVKFTPYLSWMVYIQKSYHSKVEWHDFCYISSAD